MEIIKVLEDSYPDLRVACHSWVAEHVLRIKCESLRTNKRTVAHKFKSNPYRAGSLQGSFEGGMNTVEGDALPSVTSSRDNLGVATSNLPPATNIDEAMAACEARIEAKIDTKLASIVALLENRLPGTESAAPPTLSSPAQPITKQPEGVDRESRQKEARKEGREALSEAQALGKAATTRLLEELSKIGRGNIGNDESDNESSDQFDNESDDDTELDGAESFSGNPSLADTDEDLSPISKLPKTAGHGGRGVRRSRSGAMQRGAQSTSIKVNGNPMIRRKGTLY
ncbi:hypothetical protein K3495_g14779 [Podosphaera aphanis]|nr:hypothetical protein K3495_g14779 [Podosphaera aphanis]